jgi:hypothetical protein
MSNHDAFTTAQVRRWLRPDAHLFVRPDAWRFMPAGAPKYFGKDTVRYFWPTREPTRRNDRAPDVQAEELPAERDELLRLRGELLAVKADIKWRRLCHTLKYNFNPAQPRVPTGNLGAGEWTAADGAFPAFAEAENASEQELGNGLVQLAQWSGTVTDGDGSPYYSPGGHHEMPRGIFSKWDLAPETRKIFEQSTTGKIPNILLRTTPDGVPVGHFWNGPGGAHYKYNEAVKELSEDFLKRYGITPRQMSPSQAQQLLKEIRESQDPRIRDYNASMRFLRRIFPLRSGRGEE